MTSGATFSRYQISEKIGEGSMGDVFLAHDPSLDRRVVLKFLPEELRREAKSAAILDHPYICKIYEIGETDGQPFVAMEYVRGETLEKRLSSGPLPLADAIGIATEIAEALETAHEQGIVHGDLTPSSIMLTEGGHVKVMDFGLTTMADDDPRSDILSFGIVLKDMVSGKAPEQLERVIKKILTKVPGERYQRVRDVRADLVSTPARSGKSPKTLAAVAGAALLVVLGWFFVDALGPRQPPSIAVLPLRNISDDPLESDYVAEGISEAVITRLVQARIQVTPWETARRYGETDAPPETIAQELNADHVLFGTFHLADDRILTNLSLAETDSGVLAWAEEFEAPYENIFRMQRDIAVRAATSLRRSLTGEEEDALQTPESKSVDAYDFYLQGAHLTQEGTREANDIAFEYFNQALELDSDLAEAHVGVGVIFNERYYWGWGGSLESLDRAEASFEKALQLNPNSMKARRGLINVHFLRGNMEAALMEGREAARYGQPHDVETLLTRAAAYQQAGLFSRGATLLRQVLRIDPVNQEAQWRLGSAVWGVDSELTVEAGNAYLRRFGDDPEIHMYVAIAHHLLGNNERAQEHYEEAIGTSAQREFGARLTAERTADAVLFGGLLYEQLGERDRAVALWQLGVDVFAPKLEETPDNRMLSSLLASLYGLLGDRASMMAMEERALARADNNPWQVHFLAVVHAKRGETDRAVELLHRGLEQGVVSPAWEGFFQLAAVPLPETEAFDEFVEAYRAETQRLRETY